MTVKELIAILQRYPSDMRVVVNGYEDGYDDVEPELILTQTIHIGSGIESWEGEHSEVVDQAGDREEQEAIVDALVLQRSSH